MGWELPAPLQVEQATGDRLGQTVSTVSTEPLPRLKPHLCRSHLTALHPERRQLAVLGQLRHPLLQRPTHSLVGAGAAVGHLRQAVRKRRRQQWRLSDYGRQDVYHEQLEIGEQQQQGAESSGRPPSGLAAYCRQQQQHHHQ